MELPELGWPTVILVVDKTLDAVNAPIDNRVSTLGQEIYALQRGRDRSTNKRRQELAPALASTPDESLSTPSPLQGSWLYAHPFAEGR